MDKVISYLERRRKALEGISNEQRVAIREEWNKTENDSVDWIDFLEKNALKLKNRLKMNSIALTKEEEALVKELSITTPFPYNEILDLYLALSRDAEKTEELIDKLVGDGFSSLSGITDIINKGVQPQYTIKPTRIYYFLSIQIPKTATYRINKKFRTLKNKASSIVESNNFLFINCSISMLNKTIVIKVINIPDKRAVLEELENELDIYFSEELDPGIVINTEEKTLSEAEYLECISLIKIDRSKESY